MREDFCLQEGFEFVAVPIVEPVEGDDWLMVGDNMDLVRPTQEEAKEPGLVSEEQDDDDDDDDDDSWSVNSDATVCHGVAPRAKEPNKRPPSPLARFLDLTNATKPPSEPRNAQCGN